MDSKKSARVTPGILARCRDALGCASNMELADKLGLPVCYLEALEKSDEAEVSELFKRSVIDHGISPVYLLIGSGKRFLDDIQKAGEFFTNND